MKNIKLLDCTLRDGGRIIDCNFLDHDIEDITERLSEANIDIIEVGFLRDWRNLEYKGNSTFFTKVEQITPFLPEKATKSDFVAFVDYGMFDFNTLSPCNEYTIDGIRVGFTKKDFQNHKKDLIRSLQVVKNQGYKLFIQGVNTLGYEDCDLLEIIKFVNNIHPYSFGIVDTYGAMYVDDVRRIYSIIDHNLADDIYIDFHSHNNFQLSFSFAQEIISLSKGVRKIIIDATLNGMGKCAGNLNTELIVDYLVRKMGYNYNFELILDIIDEYMYSIKAESTWGYSIPAFMAGIYKSHPNNVIYLTEKFRLATKDIKHIISMIDPELRQRYDYENIQKLYQEHNHTKVDDRKALSKIKNMIGNKSLLLLLPGNSLVEYANRIEKYIRKNNPFIISVNYISGRGNKDNRIAFFGSEKRYKRAMNKEDERIVVVSNIKSISKEDIILNYESLIERGNEEFDNTMIMLLNMLRRIDISSFAVAGFDGFDKNNGNYFDNKLFDDKRNIERYDNITKNMRELLKKYAKSLSHKEDIVFLTPSLYSDIFRDSF